MPRKSSTPTPARPSKMLAIEEIADVLAVKRSWIYDQVQADAFPFRRLKGQLRFPEDEVAAWVEQHAF